MPRSRPALLATLLVVLGATLAACGGSDGTGPSGAAAPADLRPNIVVIMTDDQTLNEMQFLPKTRELIGQQGTTFLNSFVSFPLCCPSRATQVTGQYAHNHGVENNVPPNGGNDKLDHTNTVPVWLHQAGYQTAHVGKYLNGYGEESTPVVPPGYDDWFGLVDPKTLLYWGFTALDNGELVTYGQSDAEYQTDVLADRAVRDIEIAATADQPLYLTVWTLAPHSGTGKGVPNEVSPAWAPRHAEAFPDLTFPRGDSYFEADVSDKPPSVQAYQAGVAQIAADRGVSQEEIETFIDGVYQARARSLLAVDDLVGDVVDALDRTGRLDNTILMFTSDNGWLLGEHNIPFGKVVLYEESVRVPLLVRGPGFPAGATVVEPVANVDLPATMVAAAGATPGVPQDGADLRPVAAGQAGADRAVLLEQHSLKPDEVGVRVPGFVYIEYADGSEELYDLVRDPKQLDNAAADPAYATIKARLATALAELEQCKGAGCLVTVPASELHRGI